ncbi:MAG: HAD family phosphatase [Verrucomicrobiota bacterium]
MANFSFEQPSKEYQAYLFDCDGTLIHSMPVHYQAWLKALAPFGADQHFTEDLFYRLGGVATREIVAKLNKAHQLEMDPDQITITKENHYIELLESVEIIESVVEFARKHHTHIPMAIVTGGSRHVIERSLAISGLSHLFDHVVTPADVREGKPAPDMFLKAAQLCHADPKECLVFEDGINGIKGAQRAGMDFVFIPSQPVHVVDGITEEVKALS